jgi:hypothetical protein
LHIEVPGITKEEAERTVRELNRTTIPVAAKEEYLSEDEKLHVGYALVQLQRKFDNEWFQTTLVQLDDRIEERPRERILMGGRPRLEHRGQFDAARAYLTWYSQANHPRAERSSITAYFKRTVRPGVNPIDIPGLDDTGFHGLKSDIAHPDPSQHLRSLVQKDRGYLACFDPDGISMNMF